MKLSYLLFLMVLLSSCELIQEEEEIGDFSPSSSYSCTYTQEQEYRVLTDITIDFDQSSTSVLTRVLSSDCSNIDVGDTAVSSGGRLARVGNSITAYGDSNEVVTVAGNGVDVSLPSNGTVSSGSSSYRVVFTDAYLESSNNYLVFESTVTVTTTSYFLTNGAKDRPHLETVKSSLEDIVK